MGRLFITIACILGSFCTAASANAGTTRASPSDFGLGAVVCARVLGPNGLDFSPLDADGWVSAGGAGSTRVYQKPNVPIRLFFSTMVAQSGQCVVDGYAENGSNLDAVKTGVRDALTANFGEAVRMPNSLVPGGQAYVIGDVFQILSSERRSAGLSIRITGMRIS